jgi:hypothetical protein
MMGGLPRLFLATYVRVGNDVAGAIAESRLCWGNIRRGALLSLVREMPFMICSTMRGVQLYGSFASQYRIDRAGSARCSDNKIAELRHNASVISYNCTSPEKFGHLAYQVLCRLRRQYEDALRDFVRGFLFRKRHGYRTGFFNDATSTSKKRVCNADDARAQCVIYSGPTCC